MKITPEEVLHVAHLARLHVNDSDMARFSGQIGAILEYVDTLNQVDTEGIVPTTHAIGRQNAFREDAPAPHLEREKALANAPEQENGGFIVPKVIG